MTVRNIFSPGTLSVGGSGYHSGTQSISNPWESGSAVWIQCTTKYVAGDGQSEFGVSEISQFDDSGRFEVVSFGGDTFGSYAARLFVPQFLGLIATARAYDASIEGTLTLFSWG
ncbi:hypothetical protein [Mycobacterium sp. RTGN5]|uniref:hypothetical protein n=1 Tax=Mycobacterium sp. RTGN5 TaxID=3016522 RepID=UPI0029C69776|nr:hypothetical protein [Mycobacterium sp. RTGN5]